MPNDQQSSRKLPSKDQVLGLMRERCATTCNPKGGCGGVCKRDIDTFTIDAIIQATAELSERSETEPSEDVAELKATIERMRRRIMGNLADLQIDDYVEVRFKDGSGRVKGNITKLWPEHGQAQVDHGWCFHPGDEITTHERGERQRGD